MKNIIIYAVFLLISMTTGLQKSYCDEEHFEHKLYCEEEKKMNIISGLYGFKCSSSWCKFHCSFLSSSYCDCQFDFNPTVKFELMGLCNGKEVCNFQTPKPHTKVCYKLVKYFGVEHNETYALYTCFYIQYQCLTATTTLSTRITTTEINNTNAINQNTTVDTGVIAGSVVGCILLVILVFIAVVFIFKRKTMQTFIDSHFKGSPRVTNPVYEAPSDGYNNVVFKNDNSPSVNVVKPDDYNHLHDIKNDNSMTSGNTYNHLGQMMGDYNHLHANNNSIHVDGAYNHLGVVNNEAHSSEERHNANYNHIGGSKVDKHDADHNHLHGSKDEIPKTDYNHLGEIKQTEIPNDDYNLIGAKTYKNLGDNYHHLGNVNEHMLHKDDYNHIGDAKHGTIVEYELAHNGDLPVHEEQTRDDVQYEITDDETGDYSNISKQQSNYENVPISDHKTRG